MRKLIMFNLITLDGYFEGPNREIDWHNVDGEFNQFAIEQLNDADLLIFGRVTYELMAGYWPAGDAIKDDPVVSGLMNNISKIVFSKTLKKAGWSNCRIVNTNPEEEIYKQKKLDGKNIMIFGSSNLTAYLADKGVIEEFRFIVNPVILGKGNTILSGIKNKLNLKLTYCRVFKSGNVMLYYQL